MMAKIEVKRISNDFFMNVNKYIETLSIFLI